MFIEVAIPIPVERNFIYALPGNIGSPGQIPAGVRVLVPFGRYRRLGFVTSVRKDTDVSPVKDIYKILDNNPVITGELFRTAKFISDVYVCSMGEALQCMFPVKKSFFVRPDGQELGTAAEPPSDDLTTGLSEGSPLPSTGRIKRGGHVQDDHVVEVLHNLCFPGRLEFYIDRINKLAPGDECIILFPEIITAGYVASELSRRIKLDVPVWHSDLSEDRKYETWTKAVSGRVKIAVGTRGAVFLPFRNLKLIIVDSESDDVWKNPQKPFYSAIDIAKMRAANIGNGCSVILAGTLMSLSAFHHVSDKSYRRVKITNKKNSPLKNGPGETPPEGASECLNGEIPPRIRGEIPPRIRIVEIENKYNLITYTLRSAIEQGFMRNEKSVVIVARRGYARQMTCPACGSIPRCPECKIPLVYHRQASAMSCHLCNFKKEWTGACPVCRAKLNPAGAGTERVESNLQKIFPGARVVRCDTDTGMPGQVLSGKFDILVGTTFLLSIFERHGKAVNYKIPLVGIYNIDHFLYLPDYRATEKAFDMAYRTGCVFSQCSKGAPLELILQTFNRKHSVFEYLQKFDWKGFYKEELQFRMELNYPPVGAMMDIMVRGRNEKGVLAEAERLRDFLLEKITSGITLLGPDEPAPAFLRGKYRQRMLIKIHDKIHGACIEAVSGAIKGFSPKQGVQLSVDVNR